MAGKKAKSGRKPKLTPELINEISGYIGQGLTKKTAIDACGIAETTFYSWMRQAEADLEDGKDNIFTQFLQSIKKAETKDKLTRLNVIRKAANEGNWQAAAWELERRYREEYGRAAMDVNLGGQKSGEPIEVKETVQIYLPDNGRNK